MLYKITGRNLEVTSGLKDAIYDKLSRLEKYFKEDTIAKVTMSVQKNRQTIEVTIPIQNGFIRAEETTDDMYASLDKVVDIIEKQIIKFKKRLIDRKQNVRSFSDSFLSIPEEETTEEFTIEKVKTFDLKPMDAEEACLQMELLGHGFYVFLNHESDEVNVVYKRRNGSYGHLVPER